MPWKIRGGYNAEIYEDEGGEHRTICRLWGQGTARGRREARMIYAALQMYDLLKEIVEYETLTDGDAETRARHILARIDKEDEA